MILMIDNYGEPELSRTDSMSVRAGERRARDGAAGCSHRDVSMEQAS
jgi:hypothetical protein